MSRLKEFSVVVNPYAHGSSMFRALVVGDSPLWGSDADNWGDLGVLDVLIL